MRWLFLCLLVVAACTSRGSITYIPDAPRIGFVPEIFVGTTRQLDPATGEFSAGRSERQTLARYEVQVPPDREPGTIRWPRQGREPNPSVDFLTIDREIYQSPAMFRADVARALAAQPRGKRELRVFVHGFNTNFAEGLYRLAQLDDDLRLPGVSVLYSWPSRGKPLAYFPDRESAVLARDGYEQFLTELAGTGAERIILIGHSMGSVLTMETLRQMAIGKNRAVLDRIGGVVLLSPDVDVDVFTTTARRIGKLPQPFFIFTSGRDKALSLSALLAGRTKRLGNIDKPEKLADLDITVIDTTAFSVKDGHFNIGKSASLIGILGNMADIDAAFQDDQAQNTDLFTQTVQQFRNARVVTVGLPVGKPGER